jgi:hypothetical protein
MLDAIVQVTLTREENCRGKKKLDVVLRDRVLVAEAVLTRTAGEGEADGAHL